MNVRISITFLDSINDEILIENLKNQDDTEDSASIHEKLSRRAIQDRNPRNDREDDLWAWLSRSIDTQRDLQTAKDTGESRETASRALRSHQVPMRDEQALDIPLYSRGLVVLSIDGRISSPF